MKKDVVTSLFTLAGFKILNMWELKNKYWPDSYPDMILQNPWWLVKTEYGLIEIGPRKRVINIDWSDTSIRKVITEDDVTKSETMVHAYGLSKALEYLAKLSIELCCINNPLNFDNTKWLPELVKTPSIKRDVSFSESPLIPNNAERVFLDSEDIKELFKNTNSVLLNDWKGSRATIKQTDDGKYYIIRLGELDPCTESVDIFTLANLLLDEGVILAN